MNSVTPSIRLPRQRLMVWLIIILLIAAALRFFRLDYQELRGDEAASWARVTQTVGPLDLAQRLIREGQPHPPIHYWLLQGWERILGESEFALRSLSALLSLIIVALVYRVTIRITHNSMMALTAMFITAVHPYQIWLAQDVKNMYELVPIGLLLATLILPRLLHGDRRAWLLYVISGVLSVLSHYYAVFGLIAHGAYLLFTRVDRRSWRRWLMAGVGIAACISIWIILIWPGIAAKQLNHPGQQPLAAFLADTLGDAALGPAMPDSFNLPGILMVGVLVMLGTIQLWRLHRAWDAVLAAWLLITFAAIFAITRFRAIYNTFYFSSAYPALYILSAIGLCVFMRRRVIMLMLSSLVLIGFGLSLRNYYFDSAYSKTVGLRRMANEIALAGQPSDVVITNQPDPATIYYLRKLSLPIVLLPPRPDSSPAQIDQQLTDLAAHHDRLWHIPVRSVWDAAGTIETDLSSRYLLAADFQFKSVRLQEYVPQPGSLAQYRALNTQFDQGVQLAGSYVTVNGDPDNRDPQGGEWLRVTLFWTTSATMQVDYKVFVHVVDANGQIIAQDDSMPQHDHQPTSQWSVNQRVLDDHEFQLPAEGLVNPLSIQVGLYNADSGQRLMLPHGEDSIEIWSSSAR